MDVIDTASRSRGTGDQISIPASQQWARIHIARFGAGAGGGTDPGMGIEAMDPIDSARRGRSKPRPPSARAARRTEIAVVPGDVVAVDRLPTHSPTLLPHHKPVLPGGKFAPEQALRKKYGRYVGELLPRGTNVVAGQSPTLPSRTLSTTSEYCPRSYILVLFC